MVDTEHHDQPPEVKLASFPKRLIILMLVYILASVSGLITDAVNKESALFCVLTLMMVVAVFGRQKAALYLLRAYAVVQLLLYCALPVIMYDPDNLVAGPTLFQVGKYYVEVADWVIYTVLIALGLWQLWVGFSPRVKRCFVRKVNMNLIN
ncbi:hypothetical protein G3R48_01265 [Shewanella intestini]|uniref:Uncharacterized protein n=1 Tax=Shewanella intestini TaxID=2017544 RepID=A0ABS5HYI9_9GAMM|nr:hypothetical protein [Shewanella intestini]MRG34816.1 hypothetical protein [Shewanella sp. XMDDZSB0408]